MNVTTKIFGEIEIADDKIIVFENGIIGFPELKRFALLHHGGRGTNAGSTRGSRKRIPAIVPHYPA